LPLTPAVISQRGYVAVTASAASFAHAPQMSAYAASKAALEAMCNSLRLEVAHHGVQVASVHPTWIEFVYLAHALRPLMTTPMFERDQLKVAPEIERVFQQEVCERGVAGASMSDRVAAQLEHAGAT
jgi:NAD(P)-dependent dehydrogenase (short-subunit alcohol dehydrogenase family)